MRIAKQWLKRLTEAAKKREVNEGDKEDGVGRPAEEAAPGERVLPPDPEDGF
uniref:Uncharacterized protein n=1 Tax=Arundo donax TaxID=35708 RepID=A0A0A8XVG5_ARUDO